MKAVIVGTGAGGATAARELSSKGFDVLILEAGKAFKPFRRALAWAEPLRRAGVLRGERTVTRLFPPMDAIRSSDDLVLFRGLTVGGCTVLSCGNMVRAERGLKDIGLDLGPEFEELERLIGPKPIPRNRWRPLTARLFDSAERMGLKPQGTPKAVDASKCASCGLCELGCARGARWDSRRFIDEALARGAILRPETAVSRVLIEKGRAVGVIAGRDGRRIEADVVVLSAGAIGNAPILRASGLPARDGLWTDIVGTLGGVWRGSRQLEEPPMVWYAQKEGYIISPYFDILSHWFQGSWRRVAAEDRVGVMVKLADEENGIVSTDGSVKKSISGTDRRRLDAGLGIVRDLMEAAGVEGPYVEGMTIGGHFGGTAPLAIEDVPRMRPLSLPDGLWIADLSLAPRSQGLPTMLTASALALRVARRIVEEMK